jgi:hypothetical protein
MSFLIPILHLYERMFAGVLFPELHINQGWCVYIPKRVYGAERFLDRDISLLRTALQSF